MASSRVETWRLAAGACVLLLGVAGCALNSDGVSPAPHVTDRNTEQELVVAGASETALSIISRANESGGLVRADLDEAAQNAMACLETAGITPRFTPPSAQYEGYEVGWTFDVGEGPDPERADKLDAIANSCLDAEYWPVEFRYTNQPSSIEFREQQQEQWRVQGAACLISEGIPIDEDAPWVEVATALTEDFLSRGEESCHATLGISG